MSARQHTLVLLLAVAYAGTGPLLDLTHRDSDVVCSGSAGAVGTHECGDREKHIPLEEFSPCALCVQSMHRAAIVATLASTWSPTLHSLGTVISGGYRTTDLSCAPLHPRGPPVT